MNQSDQKFQNSWEKTRQGGFLKYALTRGLFFGAFMFITMNLFDLPGSSFSAVFLTQHAFYNFLFWFAGGIVLQGGVIYWLYEGLYQNAKPKQAKAEK